MKAKACHAFSPASLSCIFAPVLAEEPGECVSRGLRVCLQSGARVRASKTTEAGIFLKEQSISVAPLEAACAELGLVDTRFDLDLDFPFACGFGMSAAVTLAGMLAANELWALGHSKDSIIRLAHTTEVASKTGIGDVVAQAYGGITAKFDARDPFRLQVLHVDSSVLHTRVFSALDTAAILGNEEAKKAISMAADQALSVLESTYELTLVELLEISYQFASQSGLLQDTDVKNVIEGIHARHGAASMIMLGNAVVASEAFAESEQRCIGTKGAQVYEL